MLVSNEMNASVHTHNPSPIESDTTLEEGVIFQSIFPSTASNIAFNRSLHPGSLGGTISHTIKSNAGSSYVGLTQQLPTQTNTLGLFENTGSGRPMELFPYHVDDELRCSLCTGVLVCPVRTPCEHEFCRQCMHAYIQQQHCRRHERGNEKCDDDDEVKMKPKIDNTNFMLDSKHHPNRDPNRGEDENDITPHFVVACPARGCGCPFDPSSSLTRAMKTSRMIEKLATRCDHALEGCAWIGAWSQLRRHRDLECAWELVTCPNRGCEAPVMPRVVYIREHESTCTFRTKRCEHCGRNVPIAHFDEHETECPERPNICPQMCGRTDLPRRQVTNHVAHECPKTIIACPFRDMGCTTMVIRGDLSNHIVSEMSSHATLLLCVMQRNNADIEAQVRDMRNEFQYAIDKQKEVYNAQMAHLQRELMTSQQAVKRLLSGSVLLVCNNGSAAFRTINEALRRAHAHDVIVVRPGIYHEHIVFTPGHHGIIIRAAETPHEGTAEGKAAKLQTNQSTPNVLVTFLGTNCVVQGMHIEQIHSCFHAVRFEGGSVGCVLEDCDVTSVNLNCVVITTDVSNKCAKLLEHTLHDVRSLQNNSDLVQNSGWKSPLETSQNVVRKCRIYGSKQHGILCRSGKQEQDHNLGNGKDDKKEIKCPVSESTPSITVSETHEVPESSVPDSSSSESTETNGGPIRTKDSVPIEAKTIIVHSQPCDNSTTNNGGEHIPSEHQLLIHALIENNSIHHNAWACVCLDIAQRSHTTERDSVILRKNTIHSSPQHGIWIRRDGGNIEICENEISDTSYSCIDVAPHACPFIHNNIIRNSMRCGVCYGENAGGALQSNCIEHCTYSNVGLLSGAAPQISQNIITHSKQHGILCKAGAKGTIHASNDIHENELCGVYLEPGAQTVHTCAKETIPAKG